MTVGGSELFKLMKLYPYMHKEMLDPLCGIETSTPDPESGVLTTQPPIDKYYLDIENF